MPTLSSLFFSMKHWRGRMSSMYSNTLFFLVGCEQYKAPLQEQRVGSWGIRCVDLFVLLLRGSPWAGSDFWSKGTALLEVVLFLELFLQSSCNRSPSPYSSKPMGDTELKLLTLPNCFAILFHDFVNSTLLNTSSNYLKFTYRALNNILPNDNLFH